MTEFSRQIADPATGGLKDGFAAVYEATVHITMAELLACGADGGTGDYIELVTAVPDKLIMVMQPFTARIAFGQTIPVGALTFDVGYPPDVVDQILFTPGLFSAQEIATNELTREPDGSNTFNGSTSLDPHLRPFTVRRIAATGNDQVYFSDRLYGVPLVLFSDAAGSLAGPIVTKHVVAGGSGYAPGDTGDITSTDSEGNGNNSTYTVLTAPGGVVATVSVTANPDYAYYKAATTYATTVTTGGGNGALTIRVDTIPAADGDFSVSFAYMLI